jgi:formate dehydrogenase major subunit
MNQLIAQADLGTPESRAEQQVTLDIDGKSITVPQGTSVLRAASMLDIKIPRLCASDCLKPIGSCRLCVVQIEGRRGYPSSCTTPAEDGMKVQTRTEPLQDLRRGVLELMLSDHPKDCLTCASSGDCELQDTAAELGLRTSRYGNNGANHLASTKDNSNPYFSYDPSRCVMCYRCVRTCEEVQGTFALTVDKRGFAARMTPGQNQTYMESDCVSCGACVASCPTGALQEKNLAVLGRPEQATVTTCAYCGVGCGFRVETKGEQVVRMVPWKEGGANEGHACIKGRFAWGFATHRDRITQPMIRADIHDPWRVVSWSEAIAYTASEFQRIQAKYGKDAVGGISSSRCSNEEAYLVQKLVRAAFGNNNVDTCARVCHSPTGYGLGQTYGTSAGTQSFASVDHADVVMLIGVNPTDGHPVFASRLKKRLRQGARLIVIDPRRIDLVRSPHVEADYHLPLKPGTNVATITALAHVIVTENLLDQDFIDDRCDGRTFADWKAFVARSENSPEATEEITGVSAKDVRAAARLYATGGNAAIYYGLGVTEHSQGSTMVMGIANLAMATGNIGRDGVGVNPLRGQNNVQGSCDMGSFPNELPGYRHITDAKARRAFEQAWGVNLSAEPGLRIPNMFDSALAGRFMGLYCEGEDIVQSDPNTQHVTAALSKLECMVVQDIFLNETAKYAHVFLPGASFLEKDGTFTNAERRISRVRKVMEPLSGHADWEITQRLANALGLQMNYSHPSEIMDEIASLTPSFSGVSYALLDQQGSIQWPCNAAAPLGTETMHVDGFARGLGAFVITQYMPTNERVTARYPLILTTGRILSQYNVGSLTRRTANTLWHTEDLLEIHPFDAEERRIEEGDWVSIRSRAGETVLKAKISERMAPGVVYTTFHYPDSGANVITTDNTDWATECPEFKVTAVQVMPALRQSSWQQNYHQHHQRQLSLLEQGGED